MMRTLTVAGLLLSLTACGQPAADAGQPPPASPSAKAAPEEAKPTPPPPPPSPYKNPPGALIDEYGPRVLRDAEEVDTRCIVDDLEPNTMNGGSLAGQRVNIVRLTCEPAAPLSPPDATFLRVEEWSILFPVTHRIHECDIMHVRLGKSERKTARGSVVWTVIAAETLEGVPLSDLRMEYTRWDFRGPCPVYVPVAQRGER